MVVVVSFFTKVAPFAKGLPGIQSDAKGNIMTMGPRCSGGDCGTED
jgi:hypothetical protein